jgi:endonuclease G
MRLIRLTLFFIIGLIIGGYTAYSLANPIDDSCPQHVVWGAPQIAQEGSNQYLCRTGYAVNYNYITKVAYYSVENIRVDNLVKTAPRKDDFREDPQVPTEYRSTLKDYAGAGYDRGHIAPAADMPFSAQAMSESFFLTNMMPQVPGNNRGIWKYTEELTRYYAQKYGQVYVITGTIFSQPYKTIGNNVYVPSHIWKIVIDPKNVRAIAFLFPNEKLDPKQIENYITTISEIEKYTNINISPKLPPEYIGMENVRANFKEW